MRYRGKRHFPAEYEYDKNGRMTKDLNKNISCIAYKSLNLPLRVSYGNRKETGYTYDACGSKLREDYYMTNYIASNSTTLSEANATSLQANNTQVRQTHRRYWGNMVYEMYTLRKILFDGGYIDVSNSNIPMFYHTDHLGNNRLAMKVYGSVAQVTHYYPFGGLMGDISTGQEEQPYKYNGKELNRMHGLDWYDYGARMYDGIRFTTMDPLCEKDYPVSPYVYCRNNPVNMIDPDGRKIVIAGNRQERIAVLTHMQKLTNDKLGVKQNGTVIIMSRGSRNSGKRLTTGTELISSTIANEHTMTISLGEEDKEHDVYWQDAFNGKGTDVQVEFNESYTPSFLTKNVRTGKITEEPISPEIALGHEIIHGNRSMDGKAVNRENHSTYSYQEKDGKEYVKRTKTEELETVGIKGNAPFTENQLRKEHHKNIRIKY